jgi:hypothetical protein
LGIVRRWEMRLARRAMKQRWPISDQLRKDIVTRLRAVIRAPECERSLVHAAKALLDADKLNMEQEKRDQGIADRIDITSGGQPITKVILGTDDDDV